MSPFKTQCFALALGIGLSGIAIAAPAEPSPVTLTHVYLTTDDWAAMDTLVDKLAISGDRAEDGRFWLFMITSALGSHFERLPDDHDELLQTKFAAWQKARPDSAFAPVLAAMQMHATAWRARGRSFASTVTPEGWALFRERNAKAWEMIQAAKPKAARLPAWYEEAITIGMDADAPAEEITALFNEGINRFPGYHSLYFNYARQFSPRWGGDYEEADHFIKSMVAAKTNPDGEVLYARLYWLIDQYGGGDRDFFTESRVAWPLDFLYRPFAGISAVKNQRPLPP